MALQTPNTRSTITRTNREILTVSELNKSARRLLESKFSMIYVEGEISNFSSPSSGHWYFTLKDSSGQLRSAMFRGANRKIRFVPRNGLQIIVRGRVSLYEARGDYQMIAEFMEEAGDGALRRAYEALKNQLEEEGLFSQEIKKSPPSLPQHLAIITSPTGAAIRDVLHILKRRFPALAVTVIPVQVQGEESVNQIAKALRLANQSELDFDAILLTRGGGSLEDLWSFNTEPVARAIVESALPVISAVGHETDTTIADFVADLRAPTPSAAAELLSPDSEAWLQGFKQQEAVLLRGVRQIQNTLKSNLSHLRNRLRHPGQRLQDLFQRLDDLEARLGNSYKYRLSLFNIDHLELRLSSAIKRTLLLAEKRLERVQVKASNLRIVQNQIKTHALNLNQHYQSLIHQSNLMTSNAEHRLAESVIRLEAVNPLSTLTRGYAIASKEGVVVKDASVLAEGDTVVTMLRKGSFTSTVINTRLDKSDE